MSDAVEPTPSQDPSAPAAPLPSPDEVKARLKQRTAEVAEANEKKRNFLGLIRGAKLRVGVVEAEAEGLGLEALTAALGLTTANLMLMQIVNGTLPVKDAEQAAKVAKMALDIHRQMAMDEPADREELTPDERAKRRAATQVAVKELARQLVDRATAAETRDQGPSPSATPALAIVPSVPPVPAQEA